MRIAITHSVIPPLPDSVTRAISRTYSAHGFRLSIQLDSDRFSDTADQTIRYHGFRPITSGETGPGDGRPGAGEKGSKGYDFAIRIGAEVPVTIPESAEHVLTHPSGVQLKRTGRDIYLVRGAAAMRIDPDSGISEVRIPDTLHAEAAFTIDSTLYLFLTFGLVLLLQARDLYVLHAAALSAGKSGGMLLVAPSGSGKSTIAMRLIESGWNFVSDDSILVRESEAGVTVFPFRRDATIFTDSLDEYPSAAANSIPLFSDSTKSLIDMDAAYPGRRLESMMPAVLVYPSITGRTSTRIETMKPAAAMVDLISQASFLAADSPRVSRLMNVMKRLVEETRHVQLLAGTDLRDDPSQADAVLSELV